MTAEELARYLAGGAAQRQDSLSGLDPQMQNALAALFSAAPEGVRDGLRINSAYRSPEVQARLYEEALARYGSEAEARRWVAPPGRSQHNHGRAVDIGYLSPEARAWAHENASAYGLSFPLSNEDWHIELAGARDGVPQSAPQPPAQPAIGQPQGNALAGISEPQVQPDAPENRLAMLDPAAFMSRRLPPMQVDFMQYLRRG